MFLHISLLINCPCCHFSDQVCHQSGTVHSCGSHSHQQSYSYHIWQPCPIIIEWSWETVSSQQQLVLLLWGIRSLAKQLLLKVHHLCQWNHISNTSVRATGDWNFLSFYQCFWITFEKWVKLLNCCSGGFKSTLRISSISHQGYAAEVMMPDYFSLQCMLIHNEFISAQTLINTDAIDDAFINSSFACKHQFLINLIHTSLDLEAFND